VWRHVSAFFASTGSSDTVLGTDMSCVGLCCVVLCCVVLCCVVLCCVVLCCVVLCCVVFYRQEPKLNLSNTRFEIKNCYVVTDPNRRTSRISFID